MRGISRWMWLTALALALLTSAACQKKFRGAVSQPNPLSAPNEVLRDSEEIVIITGDMELRQPRYQGALASFERYPLHNAASFTLVSRDRIRIHVQVEHKWIEWVDLSKWNAYLVDDRGRRYKPEMLERNRQSHLVSMWDYETRTAVRNRYGDIVAVLDDGHKRRKTLGSLSVFRGRGDFVFYARNIFTPDVKQLTFVLERTGLSFSFTWRFSEDTLNLHIATPANEATALRRVPYAAK